MGPGLLFVVCLLETAVFAGLILPVATLLTIAAMLSARGLFDPAEVIMAATAGAIIGDQVGFAVGRWFVQRARPPRGRVTRLWRRAMRGTERLVLRHGLTGITVARSIPFVRTMMPWFSGRSGMAWWRFLLFDTAGVILWATVYIGGGFAGGAGWARISARYGEMVGALAIVPILLVLLYLTRNWLRSLVVGSPGERSIEQPERERLVK